MSPPGYLLARAVLASLLLSLRVQAQTASDSVGNQLCHVVAGGRVIRPGHIYKMGLLFCGENNVLFHVTITNGGIVITETQTTLTPGFHLLPLKVPPQISHGNYSVTIKGKEISSNMILEKHFPLHFSPKFLSIVVQTSRPIFTRSQIVRFRILALDTSLQPYDDALEVYVVDPDGFIMRRWISIFTNNGIASLKFKLPDLAKEGYWKIRVKARDQIEESKIKVENYFPTLFEVFVEVPAYILDTEELITAQVYGMFTSEEIARGNVTIRAFLKASNFTDETLFFKKKTFLKNKNFAITIPMNLIRDPLGSEVRIEATMTEFLSGETVIGFAKTRIVRSTIKLRFLEDQPVFFKPAFPIHSFVSIQYDDNVAVSNEVLEGSKVSLIVIFHSNSGDLVTHFTFSPKLNTPELENVSDDTDTIIIDPKSEYDYVTSGVLGFTIIPPNGTEKITINAHYSDEDGQSADSKQVLHRFPSDDHRYIRLWTSTTDATVDEYAVFHVKSNFWIPSFQYLIVSKGSIINGDEVKVTSDTTTFPVALSSDMAPGFRIIVFTMLSGKVLSDSIYLPLSAFNRYEMELTMNTGKDFRGNMVELIVSGDVGAYICAHSMRSRSYQIQAGNDITESRVISSLLTLENSTKSLNSLVTRDRLGKEAEKSQYFQTPDYGIDANSSFSLAGLFLSSNAIINTTEGPCTGLIGEWIPCFDAGCYHAENRCDGIPHCTDASDELNCQNIFEEDYDYKVHRISRSTYLYDEEFGDWSWREIKKNDHEGIEFEPLQAPVFDDKWYINAFSVSPKYGFSILSDPVIYSTRRPFSAVISGPPSCKRGEQIGLRIALKNNDPSQALILLRLISSPDYKFVHVEEGGKVSSYTARLSQGQHHLLIYIPPEGQEHIDYPITPNVDQGEIEVKIVASTMTGRAILTHKLNVLPEGAIVKRHTSVMLDLKSRAYVLSYLDIVVEETPIVPYHEWRRYIYGSPKATMTINGDLIGPVFPRIPMRQEDILNRNGKGTDTRILEFSVNILNLRYLRVTNKIKPAILRETLEESNTIYAHIMKRYDPGGWFSNYDINKPSVWLTAWAIRALHLAMYADWENILYVDSEVFQKSAKWLLTNQRPDGYFLETKYFYEALEIKQRDVRTLTAHVVLGLSSCLDVLKGDTRTAAVQGLLKATQFLEKNLPDDPYALALVTLAIHNTQSSTRDISYFKLMDMIKESGEQAYWSKKKVPPPPIKIQNQRPFLQPRTYIDGLSETVETTAIALLVILIREGVVPIADKIVLTLNTLRMCNSGFVSLTDTAWALEALTEYANRARLIELTNLEIKINSGVDANLKKVIRITNSTLKNDLIQLDKVWGHLNIIGKGAGLALVQMDVSYGVDWEPLKDNSTVNSFDLFVREYYSEERNKSSIIIQTCMRSLREQASGRAVLEMEIPTGYRLVETEAQKYTADVSLLSEAKTLPGMTMWFFDYIPKEQHCFNHTVRRWHPVANISLTRQALLYEINARENFVQTIVNSTPLYVLNICEVCGSYQCPYCPFYNSSWKLAPKIILFIFVLIIWV